MTASSDLYRRPLAWVAAGAATLWPFVSPGALAWLAIDIAFGEGASYDDAVEVLTSGTALETLPVGILRACVALAGWVVLAAQGLGTRPGEMLRVGALRVVRTRAIGLLATSATLGIAIYVCFVLVRAGAAPSLAIFAAALALAAASVWLATSDRVALARFDVAQDARARIDTRALGPFHLDTARPNKSTTAIASGADDAVTEGGAILLEARGWELTLMWLALDAAQLAASAWLPMPVALVLGAAAMLLAATTLTQSFSSSEA